MHLSSLNYYLITHQESPERIQNGEDFVRAAGRFKVFLLFDFRFVSSLINLIGMSVE